jgi:hypothetical protein
MSEGSFTVSAWLTSPVGRFRLRAAKASISKRWTAKIQSPLIPPWVTEWAVVLLLPAAIILLAILAVGTGTAPAKAWLLLSALAVVTVAL